MLENSWGRLHPGGGGAPFITVRVLRKFEVQYDIIIILVIEPPTVSGRGFGFVIWDLWVLPA
jgi:hypothetical protein